MKQPTKIADLDGTSLTAAQGFLAMSKFVTAYFQRTRGRGELATLVGDIELERNGTSTDPAAMSDWLECVNQVLVDWGGNSVNN